MSTYFCQPPQKKPVVVLKIMVLALLLIVEKGASITESRKQSNEVAGHAWVLLKVVAMDYGVLRATLKGYNSMFSSSNIFLKKCRGGLVNNAS
jgi:hypothetical protein